MFLCSNALESVPDFLAFQSTVFCTTVFDDPQGKEKYLACLAEQ